MRRVAVIGLGAMGLPMAQRLVKDMGLVADLARTASVPTPVASAAHHLYLLAERAGLGAQDDSSVVRLLS